MKRFLIYCSTYWKLAVLGQTNIEGYKHRDIGNLPIVGVKYFTGYEIINPTTNKVVFRKVKNYGLVKKRGFPKGYTLIKKFFFKNVIS